MQETRKKQQYNEITMLRRVGKSNAEIFDFLEDQLGVCDKKATALISLSGILLTLITYLGIVHWTKALASVFLLACAFCCLMVYRLRWASRLIRLEGNKPNFSKILWVRYDKSRWLNLGMLCLILSFICISGYTVSNYIESFGV